MTATALCSAPPAELPFDALDQEPDEVQARIAAAARTGRRRWLWPEVEPAAWRASLAAIEAATRDVLRDGGGRLRGVDHGPAFTVAALTSGMGPLLGHWVEAGRLETDSETAALLRLHLAHGRVRAERLRWTLRQTTRTLEAFGVRFVVMKGMHTAHALFPDPGTRPMADVDLLVPRDGAAQAAGALRDEGFAHLRPNFSGAPFHAHWRPPGAPLVPRSLWLDHADNPWELNLRAELRRRVEMVRWLRLPVPEPDDLATVPIGGQAQRVLAGPLLAAYLAAHASTSPSSLRLVRLVELVLLARAGVDWDGTARLLERTGSMPLVFPALALAGRLVPGSIPGDFLRRLRGAVPARLAARVDALTPGTAQALLLPWWRGPYFWLLTPFDALRWARHWAMPTDARQSATLWGRRIARVLRLC